MAELSTRVDSVRFLDTADYFSLVFLWREM